MNVSNLPLAAVPVPGLGGAGPLGASIGRLGPIVEGLIGLVLALGLLLLVLRWAGRRERDQG